MICFELWSRNIMFVLHNICKHGIRRQKRRTEAALEDSRR